MSGLRVFKNGAWSARADQAGTLYPHDTFPTEATTGYPKGLPGDARTPVTLTPYDGPTTINTPDTVIDSKVIAVQLWVQAPRVVIRNSLVIAPEESITNAIRVDGPGSATIIDTEITADGIGAASTAVGDSNITLIRVNIHGFLDGLRAGTNVTLRDSLIHGLAEIGSDPHNDCIQSIGGSHCRFIHNRLINVHDQTSCFILGPSHGAISDFVIDNNLMSGGGYVIYLGDDPDGFTSSDIAVVNNRWGRDVWPNGGFWGPYSYAPITGPLVQFGNVWDDTEEPLILTPP
jgi:hypothetical protein